MPGIRDTNTGRYSNPKTCETGSKKMIGLRLPRSMDALIRKIAADNMTDWIRQAILEKVERDYPEYIDLIDKKSA